MNDTKREILEPIFNGLDPQAVGIMPFPERGDDGDGDGSDLDLAQIILYGADRQIDEPMIEFAIRLGRALERGQI